MNLVASHSLIGGGGFTGSNEITFLEFLAVGPGVLVSQAMAFSGLSGTFSPEPFSLISPLIHHLIACPARSTIFQLSTGLPNTLTPWIALSAIRAFVPTLVKSA